jgi:hypothetical protein
MSFRKFPLLDPTADPLLQRPLLAFKFFRLWLSCCSRKAPEEYDDVSDFPAEGDELDKDFGERC